MKCSVPTCDRAAVARGWCHNHYYAARKHGDPTKLVLKQHHGKTLRERFDLYTKKSEGCWTWVGYTDPNGYGRLNIKNAPILAHRISYEIHYGNIQDGLCVCHKCDNPRCVNPDHLFLGTQADNIADMEQKGRARKRGLRGADSPLAKIGEKDVREIRDTDTSAAKLGKKFGVSPTTIWDIRHRKSWKHLP